MPSLSFKHFTSLPILVAIDPDRLHAFLYAFRDSLAQAGFELPPPGHPVAEVFRQMLAAPHRLPEPFLHTLFLVDEMATPQGMELLQNAARTVGLDLTSLADASAADFVIFIWLQRPELIERTHAEGVLSRARSFQSYLAIGDPYPVPLPDAKSLSALETALNQAYEDMKRGRTVKVFDFPLPAGIAFLVRHGEPFRRTERFRDDRPDSISYRPLSYDSVVYLADGGELRLHCQGKWKERLYRAEFGRAFFGGEGAFPVVRKFDLARLRDGKTSVACQDVPGLQEVRLLGVGFEKVGRYAFHESWDATDLYAFLDDEQWELPNRDISRAVFAIRFADERGMRKVTVQLPNRVQYSRDSDAPVLERWFRARGLLYEEPADDDAPEILDGP